MMGVPELISRSSTSGDADSKSHGSQSSFLEPLDAALVFERFQVVQRAQMPRSALEGHVGRMSVVVRVDVDLDMLQAL